MPEVIAKLRAALMRSDSYEVLSDDANVMLCDYNNCFYELLPNENGGILTLGDLRDIVALYDKE